MNVDATAALTNYAGCHHGSETPIDADNNGVLFLNIKIRFSDIADGSSNTILIGEILPAADSLGWASGTRASLRNAGSLLESNDSEAFDLTLIEGTDEVGGFSSRHPGTVQFVFVGGAVKALTRSFDPVIFGNLGNRADGAMMGDWDY